MARLRPTLHRTAPAIGLGAIIYGCGLGVGGQNPTAQLGEPFTVDASADAEPDTMAEAMGISYVLPEAADEPDAGSAGDEAEAIDAAADAPDEEVEEVEDAGGVDDGGGGSACAKLATCCPFLVYVSATLLSSCDTTVSSNSAAGCQSFISGFQSFGLCM